MNYSFDSSRNTNRVSAESAEKQHSKAYQDKADDAEMKAASGADTEKEPGGINFHKQADSQIPDYLYVAHGCQCQTTNRIADNIILLGGRGSDNISHYQHDWPSHTGHSQKATGIETFYKRSYDKT